MAIRTGYEHGEFCWVDLMAHDLDGARDFYSNFFSWQAVEQDTQGGPRYVIFQKEGHDVAGCGQMPTETASQGIPPIWSSYINVDDLEAVCKRVEELGGTIAMPPMQVVDAGSMAFILDPTGASVALWQKNQHFGASLVNSIGAFCWNELATRDTERAQQFFHELLGWEYEEAPSPQSQYFVIKNRGRDNGGIIPMNEQGDDMPPNWNAYFTVGDIDRATSQIRELGGQVLVPPFDISIGRMGVINDVQGAALNIIQMNEPPE